MHSKLNMDKDEKDLSLLGLKNFHNTNYKYFKSYSQSIIIPMIIDAKHV